MPKTSLIIEKTKDGFLGRVNYDNNLIVVEGESIPFLEKSISALLKKYHNVPLGTIKFQYKYDLTSLFEVFNYLKISNIAEVAGLNPSLLRQYVTGNKFASVTQAKRIESAIHQIALDLLKVNIYSSLENN